MLITLLASVSLSFGYDIKYYGFFNILENNFHNELDETAIGNDYYKAYYDEGKLIGYEHYFIGDIIDTIEHFNNQHQIEKKIVLKGNMPQTKTYYQNGLPVKAEIYRNYKLVAYYTQEYEASKIVKENYYVLQNGNFAKKLSWFYDNEIMIKCEKYDIQKQNGTLQNIYQYEYYDSGIIKKKIDFNSKEQLINKWYYYETGQIEKLEFFANGIMKKIITYDFDGRVDTIYKYNKYGRLEVIEEQSSFKFNSKTGN